MNNKRSCKLLSPTLDAYEVHYMPLHPIRYAHGFVLLSLAVVLLLASTESMEFIFSYIHQVYSKATDNCVVDPVAMKWASRIWMQSVSILPQSNTKEREAVKIWGYSLHRHKYLEKW